MSTDDRHVRVYFGWDFDKTKRFYKENPPVAGDNALIISTQASCVTYEIAKIVRVSAARIYFDKSFGWGGSSFYYSGKNCWSPKGQTRLVPPIDKIVKFMKRANKVAITFTEFQREDLFKFLDEIGEG